MRCQACGADVVQQAIYCHKCGGRLAADHSFATAGEEGPAGPEAAALAAEDGTPTATTSATERVRATVAGNLHRDDDQDRELWKGGYSPKAMLQAWFLTAAVTIGLLALWIWWQPPRTAWLALVAVVLLLWLYQLLVLAYRRINVRYLLTTQRFLFEKGILRRVTDCIEVIDIDDITCEQGILERLMGVGTIRVSSTDRSSPEVVMAGIENVKEVTRTMDEVRRNERRRRGLHIEQI